MNVSAFFDVGPYTWTQEEKEAALRSTLIDLLMHHRTHCPEYDRILENVWMNNGSSASVEALDDLPYIPVGVFKTRTLKSVPDEEVFKELTSSGTTGQSVSRIFLDTETAGLQSKALATIMADFIGKERLPMIIVDSKGVLKDPRKFSARGAGILGMSTFGRDHFYALNPDMSIDLEGLQAFLDRNRGSPFLVFGFTFMVWAYFLQVLEENLDLAGGILVHSGGWKKLIDQSVDNDEFKRTVKQRLNIARVHNFYGMVEQVGSVFVECEEGSLHAPCFADVIARDHATFSPSPVGRKGIIEVISVLPKSYPGNVLLTEDEGTVVGIDDCPCGRLGKRFVIHGRLPRSEIRGCSDVHQQGGAVVGG